MNKPCIIVGGGGHASVLCDILLSQGREIIAVVSPDPIYSRSVFTGIDYLNIDEDVFEYSPDKVELINGIGPMPFNNSRKNIANFFEEKGYKFGAVVSENAAVSAYASIGESVQILHGAVVQVGSKIGRHSVINTCAVVEHDCLVGEFNHIAPNATLCGETILHDRVFIGAGSTVIQGLTLGQFVTVGAGAVVSKDIKSNSIVYPARSSLKGDI